MKWVVYAIMVAASFTVARLLLDALNPNDPEGGNLLVTIVVAVVVWFVLYAAYRLVPRGKNGK